MKNETELKKYEADDDEVFEVKEITTFKDGSHTGKITSLEVSEREYRYIDIEIETLADNGNMGTLKLGFPATISVASGFGRFLQNSGLDVEKHKEFTLKELRKHLINKEVTFTTFTDATEFGNFSRIVTESIKFL